MRDMTFEVVEDTVKNFTRMSLSDFEHITSFIEPSVKKMDTQFRTPELAFSFRHLCPSMRPRVYFCYGN